MVDQLIELIASGLPQQQVAQALGCSEAFIREEMLKPAHIERLKVRAKELQQERIELRYASLEEDTLKQLKTDLGMMDAQGLCRVLETVSRNRIAARNPANHFTNPTAQGATAITLVLPAAASDTKILVDSKNQVVAIDNRSMATLPVQGVQKLFAQLASTPADLAPTPTTPVEEELPYEHAYAEPQAIASAS